MPTYIGGAGVALVMVERLIWRACSRTRSFASTMEEAAMAVVERQRTKEVAGFFWLAWTRIRAAGRAMVEDVQLDGFQ